METSPSQHADAGSPEKPTGSLRTFHIVFIVASVLALLVFGLWALNAFLTAGGAGNLIWFLTALVLAAALVVYGLWFWRKIKSRGIS